MYCHHCGTQIPHDARFCSNCGKSVVAATPVPGRVDRHLPTLALLWIIYAVLRLLNGAAMMFIGAAFLPRFFEIGWGFPHFFLPRMVSGIGFGVLLLGVVALAAGWGLWHREPWARVVVLVLGLLSLFHFPLGTALGIYTLWVLLPNESATQYTRPISSS
jgi:predicted nucleic acid-binding Zn ribbon protein